MPEVLTDAGFREYEGVRVTRNSDQKLSISVDGIVTNCTMDHRFKLEDGTFAYAKDLSVGDVLSDLRVIDGISSYQNTCLVYDLINVNETRSYYTNNVISHNCVYLDEFAFVENADTFYTSTYPVISSGADTKVLITSTPNGMNLFYKLWEDARMERNDFKHVQVHWSENPKRDAKWKETTLKNIGKRQFAQEYECAFHGSSGTLIAGETLAELVWQESQIESEHLKVYEKAKPGHSYIATVDVSEGVGSDYSVINITNITEQPYKQVAVYRCNIVSPLVLPEIVERMAKEYNEAFILVETNSIGSQVSNILWNDYEYENMIVTTTENQDNRVSGGFSSRSEIGIRMTKKSKRIGCSNIKALIENKLYLVNDFETIQELQTFVQRGVSYEAEDGKHDDVVMTLVALGWLATQDYFKDLMDVDNRAAVLARQLSTVEDDIAPAGFHNDCNLDTLNSDESAYGDDIITSMML